LTFTLLYFTLVSRGTARGTLYQYTGCVQFIGLEQSLWKSFVILYRHRRRSESRADIETLRTLMSVCGEWRQMLVSDLLSRLKTLVAKGMSVSLILLLRSFNGRFSRTTWVSRHQKSRTILVKPVWIYWSKK